jgi:hypothetical protein
MDDFDFQENENFLFEDPSDPTNQGRRPIELNTLQKNKIKETLKKMDENLVQPQLSVGKSFSGAGFACKPEKIIYKDFEVGVPMSITIELTNRSYSFNSFKLLPLDDELIDFFEIDYRPCGRVPAGISTTMTLKFTPMVDKDYFGNLKLLSETGMVLIPIECLSKKCIIEIENPSIDFGEVIIGEEIKKQINLENKGALSCSFSFLDEDKGSLGKEIGDEKNSFNENLRVGCYEDFNERKIVVHKNDFLFENQKSQENMQNLQNLEYLQNQNKNIIKKFFIKQLTYLTTGKIDSYSKKSLPFTLQSKFIGEYSLTLLMKIDYKKTTEYKPLHIKFKVVDLPIYSDLKTYELDYLIEGNIFREKLTLYNNSNISYKLQIYNHKEIDDFVELNPNLGYIQANSTFDIWIKLKISKKIHELNKYFKINPEQSEYIFPLKIVITNISVPIILNLHFFVTNDTINLQSSFLNFDKCFIDESNKIQICMENKSLLPMKYGFIMLPKEFRVKNNIDYILPNEKVYCDVIYDTKDSYLGHREGDIFCRNITDELTVKNMKLKYHVELLSPEVEIKPKNILFPALPIGERKSIRLVIYNRSKEDYLCEFLTPPICISGLTIMPKVFELNAGKYTSCVVEYLSEFRPYGPFSFENVEKELGYAISSEEDGKKKSEENKVSEITKENFNKDKEIHTHTSSTTPNAIALNPLLEEKIKKELESSLAHVEGQGNDKNKKKAPEPKKEAAAAKKPLDPKKDKKLIEEEERRKKEEEERLVKEAEDKKAFRIQNFNREKELKLFAGEITSFDDSQGKSEHSQFIIPLCYKNIKLESANLNNNTPHNYRKTFIKVATTCVEKTLIFDMDILDFGEVSVKTRKVLTLNLYNNSDKPADIKLKPLIASNGFGIVNAVREIPPKSRFSFIVEFSPLKDLPYFDEICVYTEETQSTIKVRGKGVQPEITTSVEEGILFLGNSCVGNTLDKSFDIVNKSSFQVDYEIKILKSGKKNRNGFKAFSFIPYKGVISANNKINIKVSFFGDHQDFNNFFEMILVDVANQKKPNLIFVSASCWTRQVYWREFFTPTSEISNHKSIEQDYFIEPLKQKSMSNGTNNERILLEFVKYTEKTEHMSKEEIEKMTKRKIIVGNCKLNDVKMEKNGTYEVILPVSDNERKH